MAEAAKVNEEEITVPSIEQIEEGIDNEQEPSVTLSASEEKAKSSGWMPLDEWEEAGRDPSDWVSAEVFNVRGEFFDKIHKKNREIDDLHNAINDLKRLHGKIAEKEREKVIKELKKAKALAMENDDFDAVVDIDEKMSEVKQQTFQQEQSATPKEDPDFRPTFEKFVDENPWYNNDSDMRVYADAIGLKMAQQGKHYTEVFQEVSKKVRENFPHKFSNPNRQKSVVDGGERTVNAGRGKGKTKYSYSDLSAEQKDVCRTYEKLGVLTRDEYIKSLVDAGELG